MMVTTVLAVQSFSKIVFGRELPLGVVEYRLHVFALIPPLLIFGTANAINGMGPFLYFQGLNLQSGAPGYKYAWFAVAFFIFIISVVIATSSITIRRVNFVSSELGRTTTDVVSAAMASAIRRLHSFMIAACFQWIPCAILIAVTTASDSIEPYGFRMFLFFLGIAGANLGGVFNTLAYLYNEHQYKRERERALEMSGSGSVTTLGGQNGGGGGGFWSKFDVGGSG
ncbi:hypothetical protein HK104_002764, partial [Borealophlyctis nickersoniae]